jgi:predicted small lipoprotein YifL
LSLTGTGTLLMIDKIGMREGAPSVVAKMNRTALMAFASAWLVVSAGCGQKGPLVADRPAVSAAASGAPASAARR